MTSFLTFTVSQQLKMFVISNVIVISSFLNESSSDLVEEVKIISLFIFIAQKLIVFIICYKRENFDSDFGHFLAKNVLKIGSTWQQPRFLVTKRYIK